MSKTLTIAFYGEGTTDEQFLPTIIKRTATQILIDKGATDVEVWDVLSMGSVSGRTSVEKIESAAKEACGYSLLVVHIDADGRDLQVAKEERFNPGEQAIQDMPEDTCQKNLIPIIPIKNIESWMLCDINAFQQEVGTNLRPTQLGIPERPHQVESIPVPKATYYDAVRKATDARGGRRRADPGRYYAPLSQTIRLDELQRVPSFLAFKKELENLLRRLHYTR